MVVLKKCLGKIQHIISKNNQHLNKNREYKFENVTIIIYKNEEDISVILKKYLCLKNY